MGRQIGIEKKRQKGRREADETLDDLDLDDRDFDDLVLALKEEERLRKEDMMMAYERGYLGRENMCVPFQF